MAELIVYLNIKIIIYTTIGSREEAKKFSKHIIENKLAGCTNISEINSMYFWEDKITDEKEFAILIKTTKEKVEELKKEIKKVHPYEIPCIIELKAEANEDYFKWIKKSIS